VCLVTGAAGGLGQATARRLATAGARVACADVDGAAADRVARELEGSGIGLTADVSDPTSVDGAVAQVLEKWGRIDVLVANAGIRLGRSGLNLALEDWNRVLAVNLTGTWLSMRAVLPHMTERRSGSVVATSRVASLRGVGSAAYSAAKGGINALVRQLAVDVASTGVRVNAVCPGPMRTPMLEGPFRERAPEDPLGAMDAHALERVPLRRLGEPDDFAALVCFLASDDARWITGAVYPLDGGMTAR
jgi:NAD(P)-dependent dehydrogenase (short-subunit alcohol dehydrogenase family)